MGKRRSVDADGRWRGWLADAEAKRAWWTRVHREQYGAAPRVRYAYLRLDGRRAGCLAYVEYRPGAFAVGWSIARAGESFDRVRGRFAALRRLKVSPIRCVAHQPRPGGALPSVLELVERYSTPRRLGGGFSPSSPGLVRARAAARETRLALEGRDGGDELSPGIRAGLDAEGVAP